MSSLSFIRLPAYVIVFSGGDRKRNGKEPVPGPERDSNLDEYRVEPRRRDAKVVQFVSLARGDEEEARVTAKNKTQRLFPSFGHLFDFCVFHGIFRGRTIADHAGERSYGEDSCVFDCLGLSKAGVTGGEGKRESEGD